MTERMQIVQKDFLPVSSTNKRNVWDGLADCHFDCHKWTVDISRSAEKAHNGASCMYVQAWVRARQCQHVAASCYSGQSHWCTQSDSQYSLPARMLAHVLQFDLRAASVDVRYMWTFQ